MKAILDPKIVLSAIVALLILGYAYHRMGNLIQGPRIAVTLPQNGAVFDSPFIRIAGTSRNNTVLTINGRAVFTDESGGFSEELLLARGYNALEVRAEDRFGRSATEKIEVVRR